MDERTLCWAPEGDGSSGAAGRVRPPAVGELPAGRFLLKEALCSGGAGVVLAALLARAHLWWDEVGPSDLAVRSFTHEPLAVSPAALPPACQGSRWNTPGRISILSRRSFIFFFPAHCSSPLAPLARLFRSGSRVGGYRAGGSSHSVW